MCNVFLVGHNYQYEVLDILKNFCDGHKISFVDKRVLADGQSLFVESILHTAPDRVTARCIIDGGERKVNQAREFPPVEGDELELRKQYKRMVKHSVLAAAEQYFGKRLPWGILLGIRPVKIVHQLLDRGIPLGHIEKELLEFYRLDPEKAKLLIEIALRERKYILPYDSKKVSIYISIPFCPSRCIYCSFPSHQLDKWGHMLDRYIDCLIREMEAVYSVLKSRGYAFETVYIGGGTPTSLNCQQLSLLMEKVREFFVCDGTVEFTVEAGRPDTLDRDKLKLLKETGATRISINPQSMNAITLKRIGRSHTPQDIVEAFGIAREEGHNNINMDIIIGLPGEDLDMVRNTLESILRLEPEGLTVHTLALKKASRLREEVSSVDWVSEKDVVKMLELAERYARGMGMNPYYLYRQKYMAGNLENVGYSFPGFEGIYNMQIMEEKQTIIGIGAGAVSKLVFLEEDRLERLENVKNVYYYISRFEEIVKKKLDGLKHLWMVDSKGLVDYN